MVPLVGGALGWTLGLASADLGDISDSVGASLIGAGMTSVLVNPFIATRLAGAPASDERSPAEH